MRFHLIDRIEALESGQAVRARKLTSRLESYWRDEGRGVEMPAPLVLESLCQAGSWLVLASTNWRSQAVLLSVDAVSFAGPVRPGDVLELHGVVESISDERAALSGTASVAGRIVMRADTILCGLTPVADLQPAGDILRMRAQLVRART